MYLAKTEPHLCRHCTVVAKHRWVSWKQHVELLHDLSKVSTLGPNSFIPFGMRMLVANSHQEDSSPAATYVVTADNLPALYITRMMLMTGNNVVLSGNTGTLLAWTGWLESWWL